MKKIVVLGSTGSIGRQTLDVVRAFPEEFDVVGLAAGANQGLLLQQVDEFHRAVGLTGLTITKLDGTAKGGIVFALAKKAVAPIRYIGVGEKIDDLRPFTAKDFINALFD